MPVNPEFLRTMSVNPAYHPITLQVVPIQHRGQKIMATRATCKQDGCRWSCAYVSKGGGIAGAWKHRQKEILDLRTAALSKVHRGDQRKVARDLIRATDKRTHTEAEYKVAVDVCLASLGVTMTDWPTWELKLMNWYNVGLMAIQVADIIHTRLRAAVPPLAAV